MAEDIELLLDMGFTKERAQHALSVTGYKGVEPAAEWLLSHPEETSDGSSSGSGHILGSKGAEATGEPTQEKPQEALSLKCDTCGKLLRSDLELQAHAARTGHVNFSESTEEIKPLTEEQKKEQAERLQEKIRQKRAEREAREKEEEVHREKVRRKTGQEISQIRHDMELKEAKKIAEQKKREKMEEKLARQKVKEEIARDRAARAEKEKEKQSATAPPQEGTQPNATAATNTTQPKKEYDTCRLQIRLFGGKTLINTFQATDTLVDVNRYILMNRTDDQDEPYSLMTSFPRKVFTSEDSNKSLKELGLVPSSVIILTKSH